MATTKLCITHGLPRQLLVATIVAAMLIGVTTLEAAAQFGVKPVGGLWCGLTRDGGTVRLTVTSDGRWIQDITIREAAGVISSGEGVTSRAQVVTSKFIYRSGSGDRRVGSIGRCKRPPCRGEPAPPSGATIRGTFRSPDYLKGTFTALATKSLPGGRAASRRYVGSYVGWPASVAPCP